MKNRSNNIEELKKKREELNQKSKIATSNYWESLKDKETPKIMTYDDIAKYYYNVAIKSIDGFKINEINAPIMKMMCQYFANDESFCIGSKSKSLKKGITLVGGVGTGKTTFMKIFKINQRKSYAVISARTMANDFTKNGIEALEFYSKLIPTTPDKWGCKEFALCIDDIGTDETKKHYGDQVNIVQEIISDRYDRNLLTHATTNLNEKQIISLYGVRCYDRMKEMFNFIPINPEMKSWR